MAQILRQINPQILHTAKLPFKIPVLKTCDRNLLFGLLIEGMTHFSKNMSKPKMTLQSTEFAI
jgi:hypothetical protein